MEAGEVSLWGRLLWLPSLKEDRTSTQLLILECEGAGVRKEVAFEAPHVMEPAREETATHLWPSSLSVAAVQRDTAWRVRDTPLGPHQAVLCSRQQPGSFAEKIKDEDDMAP